MDLTQYKTIIESELFKVGPVVAFIWVNKKDWPVYSVSQNIKTLYGYEVEEFQGSKLKYASLIHKDDRERVFDEVAKASLSDALSFEHEPYRLFTKDGSYKWIHDTTIIVKEGDVITHFIGYLRDVSLIQELENHTLEQNTTLLKHEALFKSYKLAMDASSIVSKADLQGNFTYVNEKFCQVSGYTREEVIGCSHNLLRSPSMQSSTFEELWDTIQDKKVWQGVLLNRGKYNEYWVDISILPILDENDEIIEYIAVRHDITKMIEQQKKLDNIANTDILTGYGNRYKLNNDIQKSKQPALVIINIDNFSQINDFYGHVKGDKVIQQLGNILENIIYVEHCELYHLQGDEYVILNLDVDAELFVKRVKTMIAEIKKSSIKIKEEILYLNVSAAISFETQERLLETADMALKVAKKRNKSLIVYSDGISLNNEYENNLKWTRKIKEAIEEDRIVPVFQPIVNNTTLKWDKYESLVRLKEKDGTLTSPFHFLEISKKTKLYGQITRIMLKKSFENFKNREEEFSVNLTVKDILNEITNNFIINLLEEYKISHRVVFEIVESESIENLEEVAIFLQKVKSFGAKIAIDDFGTGYSNFEYLLRLKADFIKIDGSMIKDIDTNEEAQLVVSIIVDFAKKMNIKTIAEFVENESVFRTVKELGIDYTQGFYFSKPLAII